MSVCSSLRHFQRSDRSVLMSLTGKDGTSTEQFNPTSQILGLGRTGALCASLSTDHVSLRSSFIPGVYQTWHGDPPYPATAQWTLNTAHSSSLSPFLPCPPPFLSCQFAHDRELCWSGLWLIKGPFGIFYILASLMGHESFPQREGPTQDDYFSTYY